MSEKFEEYIEKKLNLLNQMIDSKEYNNEGVLGVSVKNGELNRLYLDKYRFCSDYRGFNWMEYLKMNNQKLGYSLYKLRPNGKNLYIVKNSKENVFVKLFSESVKIK